MRRTALAIFAHPDDIEYFGAGTLLLLREAGFETHYFNLSTGSCGSVEMDADETRRIRRAEAEPEELVKARAISPRSPLVSVPSRREPRSSPSSTAATVRRRVAWASGARFRVGRTSPTAIGKASTSTLARARAWMRLATLVGHASHRRTHVAAFARRALQATLKVR